MASPIVLYDPSMVPPPDQNPSAVDPYSAGSPDGSTQISDSFATMLSNAIKSVGTFGVAAANAQLANTYQVPGYYAPSGPGYYGGYSPVTLAKPAAAAGISSLLVLGLIVYFIAKHA